MKSQRAPAGSPIYQVFGVVRFILMQTLELLTAREAPDKMAISQKIEVFSSTIYSPRIESVTVFFHTNSVLQGIYRRRQAILPTFSRHHLFSCQVFRHAQGEKRGAHHSQSAEKRHSEEVQLWAPIKSVSYLIHTQFVKACLIKAQFGILHFTAHTT